MRIAKRSRFPGGWIICALSGLALTACGRGGGASSHSISSTPTAAPTTSVGSGSAVGPSSTEGPEPFVSPVGVAVDTLGNVYVADYGNDQIRRIATTGVVTTVAGSRKAGDADGTGTTASFHFPEGVALDSAGNVYVADYGNNGIRKITPAGVVTTLAGLGAPGDTDGAGRAASFNGPEGVAADSAGNVYVADYGNNEIRRITPAGVVTTIAGSGKEGNADGTGKAASFNGPEGVAVDSVGNVYVADYGNNEIRKITPAGVVTTLAGSGAEGNADGTGRAASFDNPEGVAVDSAGNVYVGDEFNNAIRKITPAGLVTTLAGSAPHKAISTNSE